MAPPLVPVVAPPTPDAQRRAAVLLSSRTSSVVRSKILPTLTAALFSGHFSGCGLSLFTARDGEIWCK